ncbi:MAG: GNAT family N-acetyltransferase [Bacteroidota bacterium]
MIIRQATSDDNQALIDICRKAPMEGIVTAYVDQSPNFFEMPRIQGDDYNVWVAEKDENKIEGCVIESYKTIRYNNGVHKAFYIGDLKVAPESRGTLGITLSSHIINQAKQKGFDIGECFVIDGNNKMLKVLDWLSKKIFKKVHSGHATIYQILPYKKYKISKNYLIRNADAKDINQIIDLLENTYKDYSSSPIFNKETFEAIINKSTTFDISNFKVAEKEGKIVACISLWDQSDIRRTVVEKFSGSGKIAVNVLKFARLFLKTPKIPNEGDTLKYIFLRFPAALPQHIDALQDLIRHESNVLRKMKKYHFIWAGFHEADSLKDSIDGMWKLTMKINIFHLKFNDNIELLNEDLSSKQPVYVDFSLI